MGTLLLCAAIAAVGTAACESPHTEGELPAGPEVIESLTRYQKEYALVPGDVIEVVLVRHPELSRTVIVRPDGRISLPLLDDVAAASRTCAQLDDELTRLFDRRLKDPEVSVVATSVRPARVYVFGEVIKPSPVELRNASTAAQAIANAGGFKPTATREDVVVIRLTKRGTLAAIKVPAVLDGQPAPYMALQVFPLQADDLVLVPQSGIAQVDAWIQNYINAPLTGLNSLVQSYVSFRLVEILNTGE